jgi:hypothetical protein
VPSRGFQEREKFLCRWIFFVFFFFLFFAFLLFLFGRRAVAGKRTGIDGRVRDEERKVLAAPTPGSSTVAACAEERERVKALLERREKDSQSFSGFGDDRLRCVSLQEAEE